MTIEGPLSSRFSRRALLRIAGAAVPLSMLVPVGTLAQETDKTAAPAATDAIAAPQQFSFDLLTDEMRALSTQPHVTAPPPEGFLGDLNYDDYRLIRFRDDRSRWADESTRFRLGAFHMGWLFPEPVRLFEVQDGMATEMLFSTDDFEYLNDLAERVPEHAELPGVAGFRLNHPLNRPDKWDELVAFVGASYFRALGRNSAYGISARGLALNTATSQGEEFPRFSRF